MCLCTPAAPCFMVLSWTGTGVSVHERLGISGHHEIKQPTQGSESFHVALLPWDIHWGISRKVHQWELVNITQIQEPGCSEVQSSCVERLQLCPGTDLPGEGLSWRQAWAGAGLIPAKSLTFIPCSPRAAGFEQAGGSLLGRGSESGPAKALPASSQVPSAQGKSWQLHPGAAGTLGWPQSS